MGEDSYYDPPDDHERECFNCSGKGLTTCGECDGKGCDECSGKGLVDCFICDGDGRLFGSLKDEEKVMNEAAYEDAMEQKAELRREREDERRRKNED